MKYLVSFTHFTYYSTSSKHSQNILHKGLPQIITYKLKFARKQNPSLHVQFYSFKKPKGFLRHNH